MTQAYLDYAATSPMSREVLAEMEPWLLAEGTNASAMYHSARRARAALEGARDSISSLLGARDARVLFTSGGTESNNWALRGVLSGARRHIVTTAAEHASVLGTCKKLESEGNDVTILSVARTGTVPPGAVARVVRPDTALVSVIYANNETGALSSTRALADEAHRAGTLYHADAAAACGHVPVDFFEDGTDLMTIASHKLGGPRGIGALVVRRHVQLAPLLAGGPQERGLRPGTESIALAVGFARAFELAVAELRSETERLLTLREKLETLLLAQAPGIRITLRGQSSLPGVLHCILPGIPSEAALIYLDAQGIACSAGSACHAGALRASHVLTAMGIPESVARCAIRISMGRGTREEHIVVLAGALRDLCTRSCRPARKRS